MTAENKPNYISKPNWITHNLNVYVILLFTTWIARFFYFGDFGLYEDDYAVVGFLRWKGKEWIIDFFV